MKIAIIADPLDNQRAGIHVYTRELVRALLKYDRVNEYVLIRERIDPELDVRQIALPNVRLPIGYASLRLFFIVPYTLRRLGVDAVLEPAHFGPFNLPRHVRRITVIHDLTPLLLSSFHRYHSQLLQKIFLRRILQRASLILSNSRNTTADLERVFPFTATRIATIPLGKGVQFKPSPSREFLDEYDIDAPYWLSVGTIEPRKNLEFLLGVYATFRAMHPARVQLVIVGQRGWKSESFYAALEVHPNRADILLTGFIEKHHLPQAYTHALALIYPSIYEGFGLPIVEALACGTSVICPANSSLTEVGGELAYYFETNDQAGLLQQMQTVAGGGQKVSTRRAAGPAWAAHFSWQSYVERFVREVEKL